MFASRFIGRLGLAAAFAAVLAFGGQSRAGTVTLLDQVDPNVTPGNYSFNIVADNSGGLNVAFAGYNVPSFDDFSQITLTTGGGPNLLGAVWNFTPAPVGSDAFTFNDGSGVPGLAFGSVVVGSYDTYDQTVTSVGGTTYTLAFTLTQNGFEDGVRVTASGANVTSTPEPSTILSAAVAVVAGLGVARRRMTKKLAA